MSGLDAMAELHHVTVNGQDIAYRDVGSGPPLLLIHGGEGDHQIFLPALARLGRTFRAIAYDQRDCGKTRTADAPYGLIDLADDAAGLLTALGCEHAHVLGHSAGGLVAQMFALRWPRRLDRLILEVTQRLAPDVWSDNKAFGKRTEVIEREGFRGLAALFTTPRYAAAHPEFVDQFENRRLSLGAQNTPRRLAALRDIPEVDLRSIAAPTLVLAAEEDALILPPTTADLAAALPAPKVEVMPGVGHLALMQEPDMFCAHLERFLTCPL